MLLVAGIVASANRTPADQAAAAAMPTAVTSRALTAELCDPGRSYAELADGQARRGDWAAAAGTAALAADMPQVCAPARAAFAEGAVRYGVEALFSERFDPTDVVAQRRLAARYQALARIAPERASGRPTSLQIAQRAYSVGQFLVAKDAFETAFRNGEFAPDNRPLLQQYISTCHNLGFWWSQTSAARDEGLRLLALADRLDTYYQLGSGASAATLREQLGDDTSRWPAPADSPLLPPGQ